MADLKAKSRTRWRKLGYHVENGEHYNAHSRRKEDWFGFADLVAVPMDDADIPETIVPHGALLGTTVARPWVYIQSTAWSKVPTRLKKIQTEETGRGQWRRPIADLARAVLEAGHLIVIEGWRLNKSNRYELRERWLTLEDL